MSLAKTLVRCPSLPTAEILCVANYSCTEGQLAITYIGSPIYNGWCKQLYIHSIIMGKALCTEALVLLGKVAKVFA